MQENRSPFLKGTGMELPVSDLDELTGSELYGLGFDVLQGIVSAERISLETDEEDAQYHYEASSTDGGTVYRGHFCKERMRLNPEWEIEVVRCRLEDTAETLIMRWIKRDLGADGIAVIRLRRANT